MGFFNFMDTFFFISLGITFILILLIVYHFKQRMTNLEQKSDTMFEIINNIVKELNIIKQNIIQKPVSSSQIPVNMIPISPFYNELNNDSTHFSLNHPYKKSEPEETHVKMDDDDDSDADDIDDDGDYINSDVSNSETGSYSDGDPDGDESEYSVEFEETKETKEEDNLENIIKKVDITIEEEKENITFEEIVDLENKDIQEIVPNDIKVIKLDEQEQEPEQEPEPEQTNEPSDLSIHKNEYRKMNIQQLKTLVQTKNLNVDVNKLKKNELVKILENHNE